MARVRAAARAAAAAWAPQRDGTPSPYRVVPQVLLSAAGVALFRPAGVQLLHALVCSERRAESHAGVDCAGAEVSAAVAQWNELLLSTTAVCTLLALGTIGMLADRLGRRPVVAAAFAGLTLQCAVAATLATLTPSLDGPPALQQPPPALWRAALLIAASVAGITGSLGSLVVLHYTYVADCTAGREGGARRGVVFLAVEAALGLGGLFGVLLGEWLAENHGVGAALWFAGACFAAPLAWVVGGGLPESLPARAALARCDWRRVNTLVSLKVLAEPPLPIRVAVASDRSAAFGRSANRGGDAPAAAAGAAQQREGDHGGLLQGASDSTSNHSHQVTSEVTVVRLVLMTVTLCLAVMAQQGWLATQVLYYTHVWKLSASSIGSVLAMEFAARALGGHFLPRLLFSYARGRPRRQVRLTGATLLAWAASLLLLPLTAPSSPGQDDVGQAGVGLLAVAALGGAVIPLPFGYMRSLLSRSVAADAQARLMVAVAVAEQLVYFSAPPLFSTAYSATVGRTTFAALFIVAGAVLLPLALLPKVLDSDAPRTSGALSRPPAHESAAHFSAISGVGASNEVQPAHVELSELSPPAASTT